MHHSMDACVKHMEFFHEFHFGIFPARPCLEAGRPGSHGRMEGPFPGTNGQPAIHVESRGVTSERREESGVSAVDRCGQGASHRIPEKVHPPGPPPKTDYWKMSSNSWEWGVLPALGSRRAAPNRAPGSEGRW